MSGSWVEPYAPAETRAALLHTLDSLGFAVIDRGADTIVTRPGFFWIDLPMYARWHGVPHPGVVVTASVTPLDGWSTIALDARTLCDPGQPAPPWSADTSVVHFVLWNNYGDVSSGARQFLDHHAREVTGTTCAPLEDGDRKMRICKALASRYPDNPAAQLAYALALIRFFREPEARVPLAKALRQLDRPETYDSVAAAMLAGRYVERAFQMFDRAIDRWPDDAGLQFGYGRALSDRRKYDDALPHLQRALTLAPDNREAHYLAAVAHEHRGQPDSAAAHCALAFPLFEDFLIDHPRNVGAWIVLGRCAGMVGQHAAAVAYFERAAQINYWRVMQEDPDVAKAVKKSLGIAGPRPAAPLPTRQ